MRIAAFVFICAAAWLPAIWWGRMSQIQRYVAMAALGAAIVFYLANPTETPCCTGTGY